MIRQKIISLIHISGYSVQIRGGMSLGSGSNARAKFGSAVKKPQAGGPTSLCFVKKLKGD